jgi:preprotein translocase subunit SecA
MSKVTAKRLETIRETVSRATNLFISDQDLVRAQKLNPDTRLEDRNRQVVFGNFSPSDELSPLRRRALVGLAAILAALDDRRVHLATANQAEAQAASRLLAPIFHLFKLQSGCLTRETTFIYGVRPTGGRPVFTVCETATALAAPILIAPFRELGFNHLNKLLREAGHPAALPGEGLDCPLDLLLIENLEALMADFGPLAICELGEDHSPEVAQMAKLLSELSAGEDADYVILPNENGRAQKCRWTARGLQTLAEKLGSEEIYQATSPLRQTADAALLAQAVLHYGYDYTVREGQVLILAYNGEPLAGETLLGGVHRALEAKEGLPIGRETLRVAELEPDKYLDLYQNVAGLLG